MNRLLAQNFSHCVCPAAARRRWWIVPALVIVMICSLTLLKSAACGADRILRLSDNSLTDLAQIILELKQEKLIFIGEVHDIKQHHTYQARFIESLHDAGARVAIGLEMFRVESQMYLDQWVAGDLADDDFKKIFNDNWKIDWSFYREIFFFARENRIPLIALNISRKIINQVSRQGLQSLSREQLQQFAGLSCNVDPEYERFIRKVFRGHGDTDTIFKNFCEAQIVWDYAMSRPLITFLNTNPQHTVVVLAGDGHSWKRGMPEQVRKHDGYQSKVILPKTGFLTRKNATLEDADFLWLETWWQEQDADIVEPDSSKKERTVVFEQGHGQRFIIEGNKPLDLTRLSSLFQEQGFFVRLSKQAISYELLADTDVLLISGPFKPFTSDEIDAITNYVSQGGRLCVMLHVPFPVSGLLYKLGVVVSNGVITERENNLQGRPSDFSVTRMEPHRLTKGLTAFNVFGAWALKNNGSNARVVVRTSPAAWVDLNRDKILGSGDAVQSFGVVVAGEYGRGRFIIFGDDAIFQNQFLSEENLLLGKNLVAWLGDM